MNAWEGQVLAIAVKELLEAAKTLGRDGFGFRKDKTILSGVIRDLLSEHPNVPRAEAALKQVESLGTPRPDYYVALDLLAKVQRAAAKPLNAPRNLPPLPTGEGWGERRPGGGSPAPVAARSSSPARSTPETTGGASRYAFRPPEDRPRIPPSRRSSLLNPRDAPSSRLRSESDLPLPARDRSRPGLPPRDNS